MSDVIRSPTARRQALAQLRASWLAGGEVRAYTAPVPVDGSGQPSADTAITTQTLLAVYPLPNPLTVTDGVILIAAGILAPATNLADGTVAFCRAVDSQGVAVCDLDAGPPNSGQAAIFENLFLVAGSLSIPQSLVIVEG